MAQYLFGCGEDLMVSRIMMATYMEGREFHVETGSKRFRGGVGLGCDNPLLREYT